MVKNIVLDTAVLIDIYRNKKKAVAVLSNYDSARFAITVFTYVEFLAGATIAYKKEARKFLQDYPVLNFDAKSKKQLTLLSMKVRLSKGHLADFLIAATSIAHGYEIVTPNYKDFTKFPGLKIIEYKVGIS